MKSSKSSIEQVRKRPNSGGKRQCYHRRDDAHDAASRVWVVTGLVLFAGLAGVGAGPGQACAALQQPPSAARCDLTGSRLPRRHQLRPRRRHRHRPSGQPGHRPEADDFEIAEDGKPQKPETFRLVKIDTVTAPSYTQRAIRTRNDEETRRRRRERAHLRVLPRRLSRPPRQQHGDAQAAGGLHHQPAGAERSGRA